MPYGHQKACSMLSGMPFCLQNMVMHAFWICHFKLPAIMFLLGPLLTQHCLVGQHCDRFSHAIFWPQNVRHLFYLIYVMLWSVLCCWVLLYSLCLPLFLLAWGRDVYCSTYTCSWSLYGLAQGYTRYVHWLLTSACCSDGLVWIVF